MEGERANGNESCGNMPPSPISVCLRSSKLKVELDSTHLALVQ